MGFKKGHGGHWDARRRNEAKRKASEDIWRPSGKAAAPKKRTRRQQAHSEPAASVAESDQVKVEPQSSAAAGESSGQGQAQRLGEVERELVCSYRPDEPESLDMRAVDLYLKHGLGSDQVPAPDQLIYPYRNFILADEQSGVSVCVEASDEMRGVTVADVALSLVAQKLPCLAGAWRQNRGRYSITDKSNR
ncbi:unnamed protein product [Vitrella brassicaformis CCMP3155]|uniref:Uncharacterized protein n=1 Tax=Vitrella brassicaformis (strain CCMP3155) TaxID=1169540 RepID=A0A0G4G2X4_VITBC|nr:unnamed protein product [Vitrella brassicaformis CCMP3155]|eukprot:CEM22064.1 unnamed protein product [Vitrella brassicaformis CCMP3155]